MLARSLGSHHLRSDPLIIRNHDTASCLHACTHVPIDDDVDPRHAPHACGEYARQKRLSSTDRLHAAGISGWLMDLLQQFDFLLFFFSSYREIPHHNFNFIGKMCSSRLIFSLSPLIHEWPESSYAYGSCGSERIDRKGEGGILL